MPELMADRALSGGFQPAINQFDIIRVQYPVQASSSPGRDQVEPRSQSPGNESGSAQVTPPQVQDGGLEQVPAEDEVEQSNELSEYSDDDDDEAQVDDPPINNRRKNKRVPVTLPIRVWIPVSANKGRWRPISRLGRVVQDATQKQLFSQVTRPAWVKKQWICWTDPVNWRSHFGQCQSSSVLKPIWYPANVSQA